MISLEKLKKTWEEKQSVLPPPPAYDHASLEKIIKNRIRKHTRTTMQYFWASFALQVLVYSLLSHVIITYWKNPEMRWLSIVGVLLYIPFTIMLMRKFKKMAIATPIREENAVVSLYDYVLRQHELLSSFYKFKKWYEFFLIPISTAIGVMLTFKLYVPGGVNENWSVVIITFVITILSCAAAIYSENKKSFKGPIRQLQNMLDEFRQDS